jgi:PKD repeat protein
LSFVLSAHITNAYTNQDSITISFLPLVEPPYKPINPDPADGAINVAVPVLLCVNVFDKTKNTVDVYFYNALNDALIGVDYNVPADWSTASVVWNSATLGRTYYWYAVADNHVLTNRSDTWHFTTKEAPSSGGGGGIIPPENIPPVANITGPNIAYKNENLIFSAYHSTDVDGYIVGYRWDFENDGFYDTAWLEDYIIEYNYSKIGNYTIILQVKDNNDAVSTASHNITIIELILPLQLPIANINGPYVGYANENISFTSKGSYDPDGIIVNYTWEFGDGNISYLENPIHTYKKPGKYTVILRITDNDNLRNLSSTKAVIIQKEEKIKEKESPLLLILLVNMIIISTFIVFLIVKRKELRSLKEKIQKLEKKFTASFNRNQDHKKESYGSDPKKDDINILVDDIIKNRR